MKPKKKPTELTRTKKIARPSGAPVMPRSLSNFSVSSFGISTRTGGTVRIHPAILLGVGISNSQDEKKDHSMIFHEKKKDCGYQAKYKRFFLSTFQPLKQRLLFSHQLKPKSFRPSLWVDPTSRWPARSSPGHGPASAGGLDETHLVIGNIGKFTINHQ